MFGPEGARSSRIVLRGSVDVTVSSQLLDAARQAAVAGRDAIVDGSEITRLDLSAVQILLALSSGMRGGALHLEALSPSGRRFLEIAGVADLFPVEPVAAEPALGAKEPEAPDLAPPEAGSEPEAAGPERRAAPHEEPAPSPPGSAEGAAIHETVTEEYDESAWELVAAEAEPAAVEPPVVEGTGTDAEALSEPSEEGARGGGEGAEEAPASDLGGALETQGTQG